MGDSDLTLVLYPGDHLCSEDGLHLIGEDGIAQMVQEETSVILKDEETYKRTLDHVEAHRNLRGYSTPAFLQDVPERFAQNPPVPSEKVQDYSTREDRLRAATMQLDELRAEIAKLTKDADLMLW